MQALLLFIFSNLFCPLLPAKMPLLKICVGGV